MKPFNANTLENIRDGMETTWKRTKGLEFRAPWKQRTSQAARTGMWVGIGLAVVAGIGAWLYLRKRNSVSKGLHLGAAPVNGKESVGMGPESEPGRVDGFSSVGGH